MSITNGCSAFKPVLGFKQVSSVPLPQLYKQKLEDESDWSDSDDEAQSVASPPTSARIGGELKLKLARSPDPEVGSMSTRGSAFSTCRRVPVRALGGYLLGFESKKPKGVEILQLRPENKEIDLMERVAREIRREMNSGDLNDYLLKELNGTLNLGLDQVGDRQKALRNLNRINIMKRRRLTPEEEQILETVFQESPGLWSKEKKVELAERLNLTETKVYKWNWERVRKDRKTNVTTSRSTKIYGRRGKK